MSLSSESNPVAHRLTFQSAHRETFEAALGKPVESPEAQRVIALLGSTHTVSHYQPTSSWYDPIQVRTERWDFDGVPRANRYSPTNLSVLDGIVMRMMLSSLLVDDMLTGKPVFLEVFAVDELVLGLRGSPHDHSPKIVRRHGEPLIVVGIRGSMRDFEYAFSLTQAQLDALRADHAMLQELWDDLRALCQSRRALDDPSMLPGAAQAIIDARCGA